MASFDLAISVVLAHENGYINDPNDPGKETKYGISKRSYPNLDIKNLTVNEAKSIYKRDYWQYDEIKSQSIATKIFDIAVNIGTSEIIKIVQEILGIVQDGVLGPETMDAINGTDSIHLLSEIRAYVAVYYAQIVVHNPSQEVYLLGWMRRAVNGTM
jgi:lysozyme family protein